MISRMSSGLSGLGSAWNSAVSTMNALKLQQAMAGKSTEKTPSVSKVGKTLDTESAAFLKEYQSGMTTMLSAADAVRKGTESMGVTSDNADVAQVQARFTLRDAAQYTLDVRQVATAQIHRSQAVDASAAPSAGGTFSIVDANGKSTDFTADSTAKTNAAQLNDLAAQINDRKVGLTAKVIEQDGKTSLEIRSTETGKNQDFSVSGAFAQKIGLTTVVQQAQDAVYSVGKGDGNPMEFTSASNTVTVGSYQLEATLRKTGSTTVTVGANSQATASSVQQMVDSFNSTLSLLNRNGDRGIGVLAQVRRMVTPPTAEKSMQLAGISINRNGTLAFDQKAFAQAMQKDPKLTGEIIGNMAQGIRRDAQQGMSTSSASLLGTRNSATGSAAANSDKLAQFQSDLQKDPLNMMSAYANNGAYNLTNYYAIGSMMNFSI